MKFTCTQGGAGNSQRSEARVYKRVNQILETDERYLKENNSKTSISKP